jgi:hypothetical protein
MATSNGILSVEGVTSKSQDAPFDQAIQKSIHIGPVALFAARKNSYKVGSAIRR